LPERIASLTTPLVDYSPIKKEIEQTKGKKDGKSEETDFNISILRTKMMVTMATTEENPMKNIMALISKWKNPL